MKKVKFVTDPETGLPHIYDQGVTEEEVRQVLTRPGQKTKGRKKSFVVLGQTREGRYLKVIYTRLKEGGGILVVTAYDLRGKELKAFRRRRRRRLR